MAKHGCKKCGDCCRYFEVFIADTPENISKRGLIEKFVVDNLDVNFKKIDYLSVKVYGLCAYFNETTNRCRIYKNRPVRCRSFYCRRSKENGEKKSSEKRR